MGLYLIYDIMCQEKECIQSWEEEENLQREETVAGVGLQVRILQYSRNVKALHFGFISHSTQCDIPKSQAVPALGSARDRTVS